MVDLTHTMGESAITWPSNEPFTVTKVAILNKDNHFYLCRSFVTEWVKVKKASGTRVGTSHKQNTGRFQY